MRDRELAEQSATYALEIMHLQRVNAILLEELRNVLVWAVVEKAPLRPAEIFSIRAAIEQAKL